MDPILHIIKYIFKKKNLENNDETLESFFENGISFPQFISLIFDNEKIPNILQNPKTLYHKKLNNDLTLQFLLQHNQYIKKFNPNYENQKEKEYLLFLIFTKQVFTIDQQEIIKKCNYIVQSLGLHFNSKNDFLQMKNLIIILNVITDDNIQINLNDRNIDETILHCFEKANVPLVIDKKSLETQYQYQFFIQIEIIFQTFPEKISQIIENSSKHPIKNDELIQNSQENLEKTTFENPNLKNSFTILEAFTSSKIKVNTEDKEQNEETGIENKISQDKNNPDKYIETDLQKPTPNNTGIFKNPKYNDLLKTIEKQMESPIDTTKYIYKSDDSHNFDLNFDDDDLVLFDIIEEEEEEDTEDDDFDLTNFENSPPNYLQDFSDNNFNAETEYIIQRTKTDNLIQLTKIEGEQIKQKNIRKKENMHYINKENKSIDIKKERRDALLRTINEIGSKGGFNFKSFEEMIDKNNIPKFVMYFLNIPTIKKVDINDESDSAKFKNIKAVIKFLKKKIEKFRVLYFDFQLQSKQKLSTILFFTNFLDFFFIRKSKKEMFERCSIILSTHDTLIQSDLHNYNVYAGLLHFVITGNVHFEFDYFQYKFDDNTIKAFFNKAQIPMIINSNLMDYEIKTFSFPIFYQLQFIFDALDYRLPSHRVVENILNGFYRITKSIPDIKNLTKSLKAKVVSMNYQKEYANKYFNKINEPNYIQNEKMEQNEIEIPKINKFHDRYKQSQYTLSQNEINNEKNDKLQFNENEIAPENFWSDHDINFKYIDGILIENVDSQTQSSEKWSHEISSIDKIISSLHQKNKKDKNSNDDDIVVCSLKKSRSSFKTKLYKFFYYNEVEKRWKFDSIEFDKFTKDYGICIKDAKTPLVLYFNSDENDIISINSNFINGIYPNLENYENHIFVYALSDKSLAMLNYNIDFNDKTKASIRPIFLSLHIPKTKQNLPNLKSIIICMYSFLFSIVDATIVILDKNYYIHQIDLIKAIQNISNSYKNIKEFSFIDSKVILLIKDQAIKYSPTLDEEINTNNFFVNLKAQVKRECIMHYININENETYENFLSSMNDMLYHSDSTFSKINNNFKSIVNFNIHEFYIYLKKNRFDTEEKLKEIIARRYEILKINNPHEEPLNIFSILAKEVLAIEPFFDNDFFQKCNLALSSLKAKINNNFDVIKNELTISAESHLSYMEYTLNQKYFWTRQQIAFMKDAHIRFLNEEFVSILKKICDDRKYSIHFEDNLSIIENQINEDKEKMNKIFKPFIDKIDIKNCLKANDFLENMEKGTNYAMKETENLREIKVTVKINQDLKSKIEQDF